MNHRSMFDRYNSKNIFIIDGVGALLSAFFLGVILTRFESVFGMPRRVLHLLAILPILFAIYDVACYFFSKNKWKFYVKIIAVVNILYCMLSIILLYFHFEELITLGLIYFILEIIIVLLVTAVEWGIASS